MRIMLTGYTDMDALIAAVNAGQIYRYIAKPWEPEELRMEIRRMVIRPEVIRRAVIRRLISVLSFSPVGSLNCVMRT